MTQYILLEEQQFNFDTEYAEALAQTYEVIELPENVHVKAEITAEDLAFGLANTRPVQL